MRHQLALYYYRYFYFRIYRWFEARKSGSSDLHIDAIYGLGLLTYFPVLLIATVGKVVFGWNVLLTQTRRMTIVHLTVLAIGLFIFEYAIHVKNGRWRKILKDFSSLDDVSKAGLDKKYRLFVRLSIASLISTFVVGIVAGIRAS